MMKPFLSFWICIALILTPVWGFSQTPADEFKRLSSEASSHYEKAEYPDAIKKFKAAYKLKAVSNILYNIGRIFEKTGDIDNAITYYDQFVVAPNVEQESRQDALERLKTLREVKAMKEAKNKPKEKDVVVKPEPEAPDRTLAYVFLGAGGVSLLGSGIFALLTSMKATEFEDATTVSEQRDAASSGRTFGIVSDSLLITGVITAALGAVFYFTAETGESDDIEADATTFRFAPTTDGKRVGLGMTVNF